MIANTFFFSTKIFYGAFFFLTRLFTAPLGIFAPLHRHGSIGAKRAQCHEGRAAKSPSFCEDVSSTFTARKPPHTQSRHGRMLRTTLTTASFRSRNVASIGNDMKKVCIELHLSISSPSPGGRLLTPISPLARSKNVRAIFARTPSISTVSNLFAPERLWLSVSVYERSDRIHDENRKRDTLGISAA